MSGAADIQQDCSISTDVDRRHAKAWRSQLLSTLLLVKYW